MKSIKNIIFIIIVIFVITISTACDNDLEKKNSVDDSPSSTTKDDDLDNSESILEDGKLNVKQMNNYIDSQIEALKSSYSYDDFENYIEDYGFNSERELRNYLSFNYISNLEIINYAKDLVKDDDIKSYYDEKVFGDIEASHILVSPSDSEDSKKVALDKINTIISELNNSSDVKAKFAELAKKYSDDNSTKDNGGYLGYFGVDEVIDEFGNAAKELEVGKYTTTPVVTSYGYHVILKTNQKPKPSLDEVKDKIIKTLAEELLALDATMPNKALKEVCNGHSSIDIEDNNLKAKYTSYLSDICLSTNE